MEVTDFSAVLHSQLPYWIHSLFVILFLGGPLGHSTSTLVLILVPQLNMHNAHVQAFCVVFYSLGCTDSQTQAFKNYRSLDADSRAPDLMSVGYGLGTGICKGSPGGSTEQHYIENTISNNLSKKGLWEWYSWILAFSKMEFCFHTHLFKETLRIYKCIQLFSLLNLNGSLGYTILGHPSCPWLCGHCSNCLLLWMLPWRSQASMNVFPFMCDLIFLLPMEIFIVASSNFIRLCLGIDCTMTVFWISSENSNFLFKVFY